MDMRNKKNTDTAKKNQPRKDEVKIDVKPDTKKKIDLKPVVTKVDPKIDVKSVTVKPVVKKEPTVVADKLAYEVFVQ